VHARTTSACAVLAWSILLVIAVVAAGMTGPGRPVQANIRMTSNTSNTAGTTRLTGAAAAGAGAAPGRAAPAARYVVQRGDTLAGIAARFAVRGGWPALYAANRPLLGTDPGLIRPGAVLVLPGRQAPARYRVVPGDTLAAIAAGLAVRGGWPALYAANRRVIGPDPGLIRPGTVLRVPQRAAPAPAVLGPGPRQHLAPPSAAPSAAPGGSGHRPPAGRTAPPGTAGMPSWLTTLLLAAGLLIGTAFLAEPVLAARRRRRQRAAATGAANRTATGTATGTPAGTAAGTPAGAPAGAAAGAGAGPGGPQVPRTAAAAVPAQRPAAELPGAGRTQIVIADYARLVVTRSVDDGTVYVLRPPGQDPAVILRAARLVLPEGPYRDLAAQLGLPASWPIVLADYDRLVVTCSARDGTVCVLRPPGQDPGTVLKAARLVLPEEPYEELAGVLEVPASWPLEQGSAGPPG
jgi:LysM repeat protein